MSVHDLITRLPDIETVRRRCRSLAVLEAVLSPARGLRYYSFDLHWGPSMQAAMMNNGSGDDYSILFLPTGALARGFAHESPMSPYRTHPLTLWPGLVDDVPEPLRAELLEPAFCNEGLPRATVCFWRLSHDTRWHAGPVVPPETDDVTPDTDGALDLFGILTDGTGEVFRAFARDYYQIDVDIDAVRQVLRGEPLTDSLIRALNTDRDPGHLRKDIARVGYRT